MAVALSPHVTLAEAPVAARTSSESPQFWYALGQQEVARNAASAADALNISHAKARNIILFVGDGMSISTVTAARILEGQMKGGPGEENSLFFENFPHLALSRTFNSNQQTPDSAGTMTAIMSGVKTKAGVIGVNQNVIRGDCDSQAGNEVITALELAELAGKSTGVVTTARLTHATPAATYAHIMDRKFEDDGDAVTLSNPGHCVDIARQLVEMPQRLGASGQVDGLEVALGGGRRSFIPHLQGADPEDGGKGERLDGRDLTLEWLQKYKRPAYVWKQSQFDAIDVATTDHLLGLFDRSHMKYNLDRKSDKGGEPSLSEMTATAIGILKKNPKGFFLQVESGRIDHAHHATNPKRALLETIELAKAVKRAYELSDPEQTLIIVTADHSHVFTMAGYATRGNPILGKVKGNDRSGQPQTNDQLAEDGLPYTTLGYTNGRSMHAFAAQHKADKAGRMDLSHVDTASDNFHPQTGIPLRSETHSGEDVAIYATGPGSSLINGVMQQNSIFHVMLKAGALQRRPRSDSR
ncbi:MAG: alkaline phosphatase [gamma proteobacterium symbiont of Bathyaustriella thionipta]|nr:alkaline phosphatase [gamma proteobacterium symbiont of Bathyaustriella thionipta]